MIIKLNGKSFDTSATNLQELIESQNPQKARVVIELNENIVRREFWKATLLQEEDVVEIVGFMGGG